MTRFLLRVAEGAVFMTTFLAAVLPTSPLAFPNLEAVLFPIIETRHAGDVNISGGHVCWSTWVRKFRNGTPDYVAYFVLDGPARVSITPYYEGTGELVAKPGQSRHSPGDTWTTRYCADLPKPLIGKAALRITGAVFYNPTHGLWLVPAAMPTFAVEASL